MKDLRKAFNQIQGAVRFARLGTILTREGEEIAVSEVARQAALGVIVVSEMHYGPNWREVADWIRAAAKKNQILTNVVDLIVVVDSRTDQGNADVSFIRRTN